MIYDCCELITDTHRTYVYPLSPTIVFMLPLASCKWCVM